MSDAPQLTVHSSPRTPVSVSQLAAMEFKGAKDIAAMSKDERLRKIHGLVDNVRPMAVLAGELMAFDKDELIAKVAANLELHGPFLMALAHAADDLRTLQNIVSSAEMRLAVALANVEGDGPNDPEDGGDEVKAVA